MLKLPLARTPGHWRSSYGAGESLAPVPERMTYLHPDALRQLLRFSALTDRLVFTDIFRSPAASLVARKSKRGVARPGYSAHNFGLAFDLDVRASLARCRNPYSVDGKILLDQRLADCDFICYREDGSTSRRECWHYTFRADQPGQAGVEHAIKRVFSLSDLTIEQAQECLQKLQLYDGTLDSVAGPLTRKAITLFQKQWSLHTFAPYKRGKLTPETMRLLSVLTAEKEIVEVATET